MLTLEDYQRAASRIGCEVAAIKAVDRVESNGGGFLSTGQPVILFEPHVFWKELRRRGIDPNKYASDPKYADILYPKWGTKPYGGSSKQHERLQRATEIDRNAALESASWGRYQILGQNYKMCMCPTLQDFINKIYSGEPGHLELFVNYVLSAHLDDELRAHDWAGFARSYNGPLYTRNAYDIKLKKAYLAAKG